MMAEMLAALLALSIALGAAGAVVQLSATTGAAQATSSRALIADRRVEALIRTAADLHTPASTPLSQTVVADDLSFACGDVGESLCRLSLRSGADGYHLAFRLNGVLRQETWVSAGPVRIVAGVTVVRNGGVPRLVNGLTVLAPGAGSAPVASVLLADEVPAGCRYDPASYACASGGG